eukprot:02353.XXX_12056_12193_1 [CDS] Oithona nana genome sequencing.
MPEILCLFLHICFLHLYSSGTFYLQYFRRSGCLSCSIKCLVCSRL